MSQTLVFETKQEIVLAHLVKIYINYNRIQIPFNIEYIMHNSVWSCKKNRTWNENLITVVSKEVTFENGILLQRKKTQTWTTNSKH